ncbi:MAG: S53 family peptidase [Bryobacteraceae bacterium]|jgi:subtilase family serine protease
MTMNNRWRRFSLAALASGVLALQGQNLITQPIDSAVRVTLPGNIRPEATEANDRGAVADSLVLDHLQLLLGRSPAQQAALDAFLASLENAKSPNYHQWITATQFGQRFGPSAPDLNKITGWLQAEGFTVNVIYPHGAIDFTGTAAQVRSAFGTHVHNLSVGGVAHIANMTDPSIPAALAPAVKGVVALHDFRPHFYAKPAVPAYTFAGSNGTELALVPQDVATIYNLTPLFAAGYSGRGQTIVLIEDTYLYSLGDWTTFRKTFGLARAYPYATLTEEAPAPATGTNNCTVPTVNTADGEAAIDVEYASAAAPNATIILAACADTATFGGLIALENLLTQTSLPSVVSISYGEAEASDGATANAAFANAYSLAVAEGVSIFVSTGDEGAASADANVSHATHGIGVSGWSSTPYNVAVGGTDFSDSYSGTNATYWNSTNSSNYGSALSYIPEIPWNDSCASQLLAFIETGSTVTYGSTGFCNSSTGDTDFLTTASGSGGPSGCATGAASTRGVVSGTCAGYAKPSWQTGLVGNPADGVRDLPDVSLFASNGIWGHYYVVCFSDTSNHGKACIGAPSGWAGFGGTSVSTPIMAGIQAIVNQYTNSRWGNPNTVLYQLAKNEYGASGSTTCNSSNGNAVGTGCIFYDVTQGDMDIPCQGTHNCYLPSGTYGVLSTSNTSYEPAYGTGTGWDFATGIGSVNAYNLVTQWSTGVE